MTSDHNFWVRLIRFRFFSKLARLHGNNLRGAFLASGKMCGIFVIFLKCVLEEFVGMGNLSDSGMIFGLVKLH